MAFLFRRTNKDAVRSVVENRAARLGWISLICVGLGLVFHPLWGVGMASGLMVVRFARKTVVEPRRRRVAFLGVGVGLLVLAVTFSGVFDQFVKSWLNLVPKANTEVRFKLFFDENLSPLERENRAIQTRKILEKRLELDDKVRAASVDLEGDEGVRIRFYGRDEAEIARVLALFRYRGELELKVVGSTQLHRKLDEEGKGYPAPPPEGYEWIVNPGKRPDPERPFLNDEYILVRRDPIVTEQNISMAEPSRANGVSFTLDEAGSKAFDDAAATLYHSIPAGKIAILIDGQPKSMPTVNSPVFRGQGEIFGSFDEASAKALATVLRAGRLPARIGTMRDGKPLYGEPESRRFIAPPAK